MFNSTNTLLIANNPLDEILIKAVVIYFENSSADFNFSPRACDVVEYQYFVSRFPFCCLVRLGGAVASWLLRSFPDRAVRVRALTGDIVLHSLVIHLNLTVPLSTLHSSCMNAYRGNPAMD